ncbi:MAG: hypothetical protein PHY41_03165 [Candidatus Cloacimonetes bacterium]|nr:hypothetical protein [Candidatus Cloacimonadota bacterium]MDY0299665.1 hypothetical protein [Candidatus Cloacimonadaceae bacterium]MCB5280103.1 hypothetical protein [Candidatus Cloacimonadota bacterium]MCK9333481.1 hypothetical protein [Candidatus Cloacimonadota bacterium]MDD2211112.1 hypothetical protein [Candidatus Cloacimonadota bacterium]
MRGRIIVLIITVIICGFFNFFNNNKVVSYTRRFSNVEKTYNAEKNINTELLVEHDDLRSGRHISSLVRVEMSQFIPDNEEGSIIYVHEPSPSQESSNYCIIDLIASRAEAKNVSIMLD